MNKYMKKFSVLASASAMAVMSVVAVDAAVTTATFTAQIIIQDDCDIVSAGNLDFGTAGVLAANVDATAALSVQCTNGSAFDIGLDAGVGVGATTATRRMSNGGATVDYQMFTDAGRTTNWGDAVGVDTVASTGTGAAQSFTIYGRVPVQTTPAAATYTDTVTVTVTF
ncbi:MAG: spore coat U domain-containing protein [Rhizobiaceae bacterium]|nr:spore coat U domain-containing protein [Rhizobiaceae bacterium]